MFNVNFEKKNTDNKINDLELTDKKELSPESLPFKNLEKKIVMGDVDGISDFSESQYGQFITYLTNSRDEKELKVFDRYTGSVKNLYSASKMEESVLLGMGGLTMYNIKGIDCVGYQRKGNTFVIQEVSSPEEDVLFEVGDLGFGKLNFSISKDGNTLVRSRNAISIDFYDLSTGTGEQHNLDFSRDEIVDSPKGSLGLAYSSDKFALFNKDTREVSETQFRSNSEDYRESISSGAFIDSEKSLVLAQDKSLVFYSIGDDYKCEKEKELNIGFVVDKLSESVDEKHLFCRDQGTGIYYIIEKETGSVVNKIENAKKIHENPKGQILILNDDTIDFCQPVGNAVDDEDQSPQNFFVDKESDNFNEDQYSYFEHSNGEVAKGAFWNFYRNGASNFLEKKKEFTWGKERLYLELPMEELDLIKGLVIEIAGQENIPIQFKFIDKEKTDPSIGVDKTRFVLNFKDVEDAKKLYTGLSENEKYKNILPDRNIDYLAHNIDGKAFYASGYREERELQQEEFDSMKSNHVKNGDGTYTFKTGTDDLGVDILSTISAKEYQRKLDATSPVVSSRVSWES